MLVEGELGTCDLSAETPEPGAGLMERVLSPENLRAAYRRVRANKGAPGVDGMTVHELAEYLRANWSASSLRLTCDVVTLPSTNVSLPRARADARWV